MIILLFGPPGSGKGTQSRLIAEWLGIPALSTGDMLRAVSRTDTDLGRELSAQLAAGHYASDDTVNRIVMQHLEGLESGGLILDGYPRTVDQAVFLDAALAERGLPLPVAVHLCVPAAIVVERLSARRQCPACRRIYNLLEQPPRSPGVCDDCPDTLVCRDDDVPEVILRRLETYERLTAPLLEHYRGQCLHFDGTDRPDAVFGRVRSSLPPAV